MKLITSIFFFCFISFNIFAENIATIKLSYIIDNSKEFSNFLNKLEIYKNEINDKLLIEEKELNKKKIEIEDSKILLNDEEYNKIVSEYNKTAEIFQNKVVSYENLIKNNISNNRKIIIKKITEIVMQLSGVNNFDLIINEDQYFLASNKIDISNKILEQLNNIEINLKIEKAK